MPKISNSLHGFILMSGKEPKPEWLDIMSTTPRKQINISTYVPARILLYPTPCSTLFINNMSTRGQSSTKMAAIEISINLYDKANMAYSVLLAIMVISIAQLNARRLTRLQTGRWLSNGRYAKARNTSEPTARPSRNPVLKRNGYSCAPIIGTRAGIHEYPKTAVII